MMILEEGGSIASHGPLFSDSNQKMQPGLLICKVTTVVAVFSDVLFTVVHFPLSFYTTLVLVVGIVYNYTTHGVQRDEAGWEQSVSIPLLQPSMFGLMDQWDKYLEDFSTTGAWLPHRYRAAETTHSLALFHHTSVI